MNVYYSWNTSIIEESGPILLSLRLELESEYASGEGVKYYSFYKIENWKDSIFYTFNCVGIPIRNIIFDIITTSRIPTTVVLVLYTI